MKFKTTFLLLFSFIIIHACNNPTNKSIKGETLVDTKKTTELASETKDSLFVLLQGKWQSLDDEKNILIFENTLHKEIGEGMESYDIEKFSLSDKCLNESNKETETPSEKSRYITCQESDLCWYIVELNRTTLTLSYMGRGNTLAYKRVD